MIPNQYFLEEWLIQMSTYPRIVVTPPGPKTRNLLKKRHRLMSPSSVSLPPLVIESAEDCIVRDVDGNEYIDFTSFSCIMNLGHGHPSVLEAVKQQSEKLLHSIQAVSPTLLLDLTETLLKTVPVSPKKKVFYVASESEAIESAIKLVKWHTRRNRFLAFTGASHGSTLGALSLSGRGVTKLKHLSPMFGGVVHIPYPYCYRCPFKQELPTCNYWCVDFIEENIFTKHLPPDEVAATFFESIQWKNGCIIPPSDYFRRLKKLLDSWGILLVDDEAYTGMGRTGRWFGIEHWKVYPDVICVGGALASGLPLGAVVSRAEVMDWEPGVHSSRFGGNPLACASAMTVLTVLRKENLVENGSRMGNYLLRRLLELKEQYAIVGDVRGKGLMIGIEFVKDEETKEPNPEVAKKIVLENWRRGLLSSTNDEATLLLSPPLSIKRDLVDTGLELLEGSIASVNRESAI
jgi:4-aminobutyrate aminotransferase